MEDNVVPKAEADSEVEAHQEEAAQVEAAIQKVYITRRSVETSGLELLKFYCEVTSWSQDEPVPRDVLLKEVEGVNAIYCTVRDRIDAEVIEQAGPHLKCICTISAGYDHIDVEECRKRGIRIGYTPDVVTDAAAELTLALLLATTRRLFEANKTVHDGTWRPWTYDWMSGQGLKDSRIGIFGFGRIGQEVATRLKPFKPSLITYTTRTMRHTKIDEAVPVSFNELLSDSDFIIVCCPLTPQTKEIFNADAFGRMKPNAVFINTARGGIVNQADLYVALKTRRIRAAGIDVTTPEPLPPDNPLLTLNNLIILPHIGGAELKTRKEMSRITVQNILGGLQDGFMVSELVMRTPRNSHIGVESITKAEEE